MRRGAAIITEHPPGRPYAPFLFEAPWPLVDSPEIWIGQKGPESWGGAEVFVVEGDDDDYRYVGSLSPSMVMGELLTYIPEQPGPSHGLGIDFQVEIFGPRPLPAASADTAYLMGSALRVGSEIVAHSGTKLLGETPRGHHYLCYGYVARGGYFTGRTKAMGYTAHQPGEPVLLLNHEVFRFPISGRHVGVSLSFKLAAQNAMGDADALQDLQEVDPVVFTPTGVFYERDPRRFLR